MAKYNWFGAVFTDVVEMFQKAVVTDFATNSKTGDVIIEQALDLAEAKVTSKLSPKMLQLLNEIIELEIPNISTSTYTFAPEISSNLKIYQVYGTQPTISNRENSLSGAGCGLNQCSNLAGYRLDDSYLFTDYTLDDYSTVTFGSTFNQNTHTYYASYLLDPTVTEIVQLKDLVLNLASCHLGHFLYSREDQVWGLVKYYCESGDEMLTSLDEYFIPEEYAKLKWRNSPIRVKGGFTTLKLARS